MIPAKVLYNDLASQIAQYAALASDAKIVPIIASFVPSVNLVKADLTLGSGDLAAIVQADAPSEGLDPLTGQWKILFDAPAGGWTWVLQGVTPTLPVTIYGFALLDTTNADLLATYAFDTPLTVTVPMTILQFEEAQFLLLIPPMI